MDYWLTNLWIKSGKPDIRYLPTSYLLPRSPPEDAKSISAFCERFHLPVDRPCPPQWVIGFINIGKAEDKGGDHYFTILFMPKEKEIHLLGKRHKRASEWKQPVDWKTWGGSNIWNNVAILHGWNQDTKMAVYEVNWVQNGYDCGVTVCQVIEIIWKGGFRQGQKRFWRRPTLPCCHLVHKQMATDIHQITLSIGFNTGNPRVGFSDTAPVPVYTVPVPGTGTYRTVFFTVFYETRGTSGTRGFITRSSPYNLAIVTHTSIDVMRTFREVFLGG
jgi:hypothetical protein